jgi:hypothetical protein
VRRAISVELRPVPRAGRVPQPTSPRGRTAPEAHRAVERKLTANLEADVAAYSRLMGADEVGTLQRLTAQQPAAAAAAAKSGKFSKPK